MTSSNFGAWDPGADLLWTVGGILDEEMIRNFVRGGEHVTTQDPADGSGQMMRLHPDERRGLDTRQASTRALIKRYDAGHNKTQYDASGNVVFAHLATGDGRSKGDLYYGIGALSTAGAMSSGFAGHRVIAGLATHVQDANDGHGERVLSDHASSVHHVYAYTGGGAQETHAFDTTGHTLPSGGRLDGTVIGGHTRVYSPSGVVQLDVNVANPHALTASQHVFPLGHTIEASVLSKVVITKNGTDPGLRSDSHSVGTVLGTVGPTTIGAGSNTTLNISSTQADTDYALKYPSVIVYESSPAGCPFGMNYCHPSIGVGLGGPSWTGSGLSTVIFWAATFINSNGTGQVCISNTDAINHTVSMSTLIQYINN